MPLHGERTGVAYQRRGHHLGVRDGLGCVVRSGAAVFTTAAYIWKVSGKTITGEAPARLLRLFHDIEDEDTPTDENMLAEINFLWDYPAITAIAGHDAGIDAATLNFMQENTRAYVEGDQVACVEVAALGSDVTIFRTKNMDQIPPNSPPPAIVARHRRLRHHRRHHRRRHHRRGRLREVGRAAIDRGVGPPEGPSIAHTVAS